MALPFTELGKTEGRVEGRLKGVGVEIETWIWIMLSLSSNEIF
jgi:hypothetical protein